ncbi:MAG: MBOAT family protein, partial [Treponema sp.]|nr:MBOAT family protein [Treponema sp.]
MALFAGIVLVAAWLFTIKCFTAAGFNSPIIVIPLGASYVSFSIISYLIDIYWERDKADKNFLQYFLYILFFPKISQGPINKHKSLAQILYEGQELTYKNFCFGSQRMLYGLFKKLVLAERLSMITYGILPNLENYSGSMIAVATVFAAIELYCDFSGYMDIILGFTECLGIQMDENFRRPFFSKSTSEFWRRWHISLGVWFKDYIYTPLVMSSTVKRLGKWCRKRIGKEFGNGLMKTIALSAVWLLTGLWHGTGANYIAWGCMCGTVIILSTLLEGVYKKIIAFLHINTEAPSWKLF